MPFAGFQNFDACVVAQQKKGFTKDRATRICGAIKARVEGNEEKEKLEGLESEELEAVNIVFKNSKTRKTEKKEMSEEFDENLFEYFSDLAVKGKKSVIEVLRVGTLKSRGLSFTMPMLREFVENFKVGAYGTELQVNLGHDREGEAAGWFKDLFIVGQKLMARIEWTPLGIEKLKNKQFKFFSAEFAKKWFDDVTSKAFDNVLIGGALTNIPAVKNINLGGIALSESLQKQLFLFTNNSNMETFKMFLNELAKKEVVTASEKSLLKKMLVSLDEEQQEEVADDVKEVEAKPEEVKPEEGEPEVKPKEEAEPKEGGPKAEPKEEGLADKVEVTALQEKVNKLQEFHDATVLKERIANVTLSEAEKPAVRKDCEGLSDFVSSLSDEQYSQFQTVLSNTVIVSPEMLKEMGSGLQGETLLSEKAKEEKEAEEIKKLAEKYESDGMDAVNALIKAQKEVL